MSTLNHRSQCYNIRISLIRMPTQNGNSLTANCFESNVQKWDKINQNIAMQAMSATRNLSTLADLPRGTNFVLKNGFFPLYGRHSKKGTLLAPSRQAVSEKKRPILFTEAQPFFSSLSSFRWHIYNIWVLPEIKNVEDTVDLLSSP